MGERKLQSKMAYLSISKAAGEYKCEPEDIIYEASIGEITIYISAYNWKAKLIYKYINNNSLANTSDSKPSSLEEVKRYFEENEDWDEHNDLLGGNFTFFGRHGPRQGLYDNPWRGYLPISMATVSSYQKGSVTSLIEIDLNKILGKKDEDFELNICPEQDVLFEEALKNDRLLVMKAELDNLCSLSPNESLSAPSKLQDWPEELKIAFDAWQAVRNIDLKGKKPSFHIKRWLKNNHPKLSSAAVNRIVTVANWDKKPGPAEILDPDSE